MGFIFLVQNERHFGGCVLLLGFLSSVFLSPGGCVLLSSQTHLQNLEGYMGSFEVMDASDKSCFDGSLQLNNNVKDSENLGVGFLEDLDSYLEDINDCLTISRMVSDSVIRGMVNAVMQEAAEKISMKEKEVAELKVMLNVYHVGVDEKGSLCSLARQHKMRGTEDRRHDSFMEAIVEHDSLIETLDGFRYAFEQQFQKLMKGVNDLKGCPSIKEIDLCSQLEGLSGVLNETFSERCIDVDRILDSLKTILATAYENTKDMVHGSKVSLCELQKEHDSQAEIESQVTRICVQSLEREFEEKFWDQYYGDKNQYWLAKMKKFANLRQELDSIYKSMSVIDVGHESDHLHCKISPLTSSSSLWEENGKQEASQSKLLEISDLNRLKHMTKEELISYYNNEMTKMKRDHESKVQEMTEGYFYLKREFFKERESFLSMKKDKDTLRKIIPEVISKLDVILVEHDHQPEPLVGNNVECFSSMKERIEKLKFDNCKLSDLLMDKKREIKGIMSQVSDDAARILEQSLSDAGLLNTIECLKSAIDDLYIRASLSEDVLHCLLKEIMGEMQSTAEESNVEYDHMQEVHGSICTEAAQNAELINKHEVEDSDFQYFTIQGLLEIIFKEAWKDAEEKINDLKMKYMDENASRVSLEKKGMEKQKMLEVVTLENERMKKEIDFHAKEKVQLAHDAAIALEKEREQFILTLEQIKLYKNDMRNLNENLELVKKELEEIKEEKNILIAATQEKQNEILLFEANEKKIRNQMESMTVLFHGLMKAAADFEHRVTEDISKNCLRYLLICYILILSLQISFVFGNSSIYILKQFGTWKSNFFFLKSDVPQSSQKLWRWASNYFIF